MYKLEIIFDPWSCYIFVISIWSMAAPLLLSRWKDVRAGDPHHPESHTPTIENRKHHKEHANNLEIFKSFPQSHYRILERDLVKNQPLCAASQGKILWFPFPMDFSITYLDSYAKRADIIRYRMAFPWRKHRRTVFLASPHVPFELALVSRLERE